MELRCNNCEYMKKSELRKECYHPDNVISFDFPNLTINENTCIELNGTKCPAWCLISLQEDKIN